LIHFYKRFIEVRIICAVMLCHLQQVWEGHLSSLQLAVSEVWGSQEDVFFVSSEGFRVGARRSALAVRSSVVRQLLLTDCQYQGISLEYSALTIHSFLSFLSLGEIHAPTLGELKEVFELASNLGVETSDFFIETNYVNKNRGNYSYQDQSTSSPLDLSLTSDRGQPSAELRNRNNFESFVKQKQFVNETIDPNAHQPFSNDPVEMPSTYFDAQINSSTESLKYPYSNSPQDSMTTARPTNDSLTFNMMGLFNPSCSSFLEEKNFQVSMNSNAEESIAVSSQETKEVRPPRSKVDAVHKCDKCDKTFSSKSTLKNHQVIHSDSRPYKCDECEKEFNYKQNLAQHKRKIHEVNPDS